MAKRSTPARAEDRAMTIYDFSEPGVRHYSAIYPIVLNADEMAWLAERDNVTFRTYAVLKSKAVQAHARGISGYRFSDVVRSIIRDGHHPDGKRAHPNQVEFATVLRNLWRGRLVQISAVGPSRLVCRFMQCATPDLAVSRVITDWIHRGKDEPIRRPPVPAKLRKAVFARDGKCMHCGATENFTADHIWPYSKGGETTMANLQTLCRSCNSRKGNRV